MIVSKALSKSCKIFCFLPVWLSNIFRDFITLYILYKQKLRKKHDKPMPFEIKEWPVLIFTKIQTGNYLLKLDKLIK